MLAEPSTRHAQPNEKTILKSRAVSTVIDELSKPKTLDRIVSGLLAEQERFIKENSILNVLLREKKQIETSLENIMAAIEQAGRNHQHHHKTLKGA